MSTVLSSTILFTLVIFSSLSALGMVNDPHDYSNVTVIDTIKFGDNYSDGAVKTTGYLIRTKEGIQIRDGIWKNYHRNGQSKDSCFYQNMKIVGEAITYDKNGIIIGKTHLSTAGPDSMPYQKLFCYDKNGSCFAEMSFMEGRPFGNLKVFRDGRLIKWKEFNKGKELEIPKSYSKSFEYIQNPHRKDIQYSQIILSNGKRSKKLSKDYFLNIELKNDTLNHLIAVAEGFSDDKFIGSFFSYNYDRSFANLKFDSLSAIKYSDISSLNFSVKRPVILESTGIIFKGISINFVLTPLLVWSVSKNKTDFNTTILPFFLAAPAFYISGDILIKKSWMKKYSFEDGWRITNKN